MKNILFCTIFMCATLSGMQQSIYDVYANLESFLKMPSYGQAMTLVDHLPELSPDKQKTFFNCLGHLQFSCACSIQLAKKLYCYFLSGIGDMPLIEHFLMAAYAQSSGQPLNIIVNLYDVITHFYVYKIRFLASLGNNAEIKRIIMLVKWFCEQGYKMSFFPAINNELRNEISIRLLTVLCYMMNNENCLYFFEIAPILQKIDFAACSNEHKKFYETAIQELLNQIKISINDRNFQQADDMITAMGTLIQKATPEQKKTFNSLVKEHIFVLHLSIPQAPVYVEPAPAIDLHQYYMNLDAQARR